MTASRMLARAIWIILVFLVTMLTAEDSLYRSATVDDQRQLHILTSSGKEILPSKLDGQVSFGSPLVSTSRQVVGWLVLYENPIAVDDPLPGELVLYRAGRLLHRFSTDQVFWDWQFQNGGKEVAYSTGPMHGGAAECFLRSVESGRVIRHWWIAPQGNAPAWARSLRR